MKTGLVSARIWFLCSVILSLGSLIVSLCLQPAIWYIFIPVLIASLTGGLPVFIVLMFILPMIARNKGSFSYLFLLVSLACAFCSLLYGYAGYLLMQFPIRRSNLFWTDRLNMLGSITGVLFLTAMLSLLLSIKQLQRYFMQSITYNKNQTNKMETTNYSENDHSETKSSQSNKIFMKGIITAALILVMMIPTIFINNLVQERQERQESVVKEVNSRWAKEQTLTGPYIYLPFKVNGVDSQNKPYETTSHILIIPDNLHVEGRIEHELRLRSIYKVLLYRAKLTDKGDIIIKVPKDIQPDLIKWSDARICFGISDFKGIEEKLMVRLNGADLELSPGLPSNEINETGLSSPISLSPADIGRSLSFSMEIKIKGSQMLHFVPFSGNSDFTLESSWPNPSFDGNNLPNERKVTDSGFNAKWIFNKANLPFGTILRDFKFDESTLAFGVTMVEPADQYAKTNRSIKYAILVIGLTFSLFFIIELMQHIPIHPIQYVLIGLALVIFYCLLLPISEFLLFDIAYLMAAVSTILLVGLYAKSHFQNWKSAGIFSGILTLLYGFIFVLIRLEDTALLVGSIGLFIILAITMYASKKVNWYGKSRLEMQM